MEPKILKLSSSGVPIEWISLNDAASLMFKEEIRNGQNVSSVLWTLGDDTFTLRGGFNSSTGLRSVMKIPAIIAVRDSGRRGQNNMFEGFSSDICKHREGMQCAYCGGSFSRNQLTIDHIYPKSKGGGLTMKNIVAACVKCNNKKADRTPEEANMPLLMKPFVPTMSEVMYSIRMANILDVQKEFLKESFKNLDLRGYLKEA